MRFVDPTATDRLDLGACECPGKPHESDWVEYRTQISYGVLGAISVTGDVMSAKRKLLELTIVDWNLCAADGTVPDIDAEAIDALDPVTAERIYEAVDGAIQRSQTFPNAFGARSRGTSRASASRTRSRTRTPTTS